MRFQRILTNENGYTLVETLVAMTLFVSVLLPLGGTIANLFIDKSNILFEKAVVLAESEMNRVVTEQDLANSAERVDDGFVISKIVEHNGRTIGIRIGVKALHDPGKELIVLRRVILRP